jgi:hypothetical protein
MKPLTEEHIKQLSGGWDSAIPTGLKKWPEKATCRNTLQVECRQSQH